MIGAIGKGQKLLRIQELGERWVNHRSDQTTSWRASEGPTTAESRIESLDVLRGFALLGILVMNIQSFSMISAAYMNPTTWGSLEGPEGVVWYLSHLLADSKFMSLFSIMFGAGIVLMAQRRVSAQRSAAALHYRRIAGLLMIGLLHAYLFWFGDILVPYAVSGALVFLAWRLRSRWLVTIGLMLLLCGAGINLFFGLSIPYIPKADLTEMRESVWQPTAQVIQRELQAYRGDWLSQFSHRMESAIMMHTIVLFMLFWHIAGLMMIGMALFKTGVLTGERTSKTYVLMTIAGLVSGLPLVALGIHWNRAANWSFEYSMFYGPLPNYFGSLLMAIAYIGIVVLLMRSRLGGLMKATLAPVGRMALTNYLAQTLICTTIFYGHGLAMYGKVDRVGQIAIVIVIWCVQIVASILWMRRYRFGPAEYAWRALTYMKLPKMRAA